jgi:hypothetical protein
VGKIGQESFLASSAIDSAGEKSANNGSRPVFLFCRAEPAPTTEANRRISLKEVVPSAVAHFRSYVAASRYPRRISDFPPWGRHISSGVARPIGAVRRLGCTSEGGVWGMQYIVRSGILNDGLRRAFERLATAEKKLLTDVVFVKSEYALRNDWICYFERQLTSDSRCKSWTRNETFHLQEVTEMKLRLVLATIVASLGLAASAQNQAADRMPSYPIEIAPEKVYEYRDLNIRVRDLRLNSNTVSVVPISCERGTTGIVLIGNGTFHYTPEGSEPIDRTYAS